MKTILFAAAAVAALTNAPAFAAPTDAASATASTASTGASTATARADNRRYCVVDTPTGSRVPRKHCNTRAGWEEQGVTLDMLFAQ